MANLNSAGLELLDELIGSGSIDKDSPWEFAEADAAALLGDPPDFARFGRAHLGLDPDEDEGTRERFRYPFAKLVGSKLVAFGNALAGIREAAAAAGEDTLADAAGAGLEALAAAKPKDVPKPKDKPEPASAAAPADPPPEDPPPPPKKGGGDEVQTTMDVPATRALLFKAPEGMTDYRGQVVRDIYAGDVLHREAQLVADAVDLEARTVAVAFSSTNPVDRFYGDEILDHDPKAVDLGRLQDGAPVLVNHEPADHVGVVVGESVRVEADGRGRARLLFGRSERAAEILQDIADGIRRHVSVGYRVWDATSEQGPNGRELVTIRKWCPLEISVASVPADSSVGVGRTAQLDNAASRTNDNDNAKERVTMDEVTTTVRAELDRDRKRAAAILALGEKHNANDLAREYAAEGKTEAEFGMALLERMGTVTTLDQVQERTRLDMPAKDVAKYSMFRVIEAQLSGDWSRAGLEQEAHRALLEKGAHHETKARGTLVPQDVLEFQRPLTRADVEFGDGATGAALVGTEHLAGSYIDALRARSVLANAGAQVLDGLHGNVSIPRLTNGSTVVVVDEGGSLSESALEWAALTLRPFTAAAKQPVTRRMLQQSSPAVENLVKQGIAKDIALKIDWHGLRGTGTGMPRGILNTTGVGAVVGGTNGAEVDWSHIVGLETAVAAENADMGALRYLVHPTMRGHLKTKEKAANTAAFCWGEGQELNGYPAAITTQLPTDLDKGTSTGVCLASIFGNVSDVLIGLWGMLDLVVDTTSRDDGGIIVKAYQDHDVGLRHAESMAVMLDGLVA